MIEKLLRAKHWQLFVATFGTVFIGQFILVSLIISSPRELNLTMVFTIIPIILLIALYVQMGWQYGLIFKLKDKINTPLNLPYKRIGIFFLVPILYFIGIGIGIGTFFSSIFTDNFRPDSEVFNNLIYLYPFHYFAIFCMFHTAYFAAKTIKTVEKQDKTTFNDFATEFLLIWFYPVGVWILQPRINKIMTGEIVYHKDTRDKITEEDDPNEIV